MSVAALCRTCGHAWTAATAPAGRCPACRSPRTIAHPELDMLAIAHIDCDAFYASVEKRDDPSLIDKPVIVGGGRRGVVSACCYIARMYGVHSAMPMFKALKACPEAVVIRPDMEKYVAVGRAVKALMLEVTPLVESLSIDEAFLDLAGTQRLHGGSPARTLVRLVGRIETELGVTASVGLSYNKFLAKIASDLDKPRGFSVLGRAEAPDFLGRQPVGIMWGVGKAMQRKLAKDGITRVAQLQQIDEHELMRRYGALGRRLARHARGLDDRAVVPQRAAKSVSSETTFETDIRDPQALARILWRQSERLSGHLKQKALSGRVVTLKLRTPDFAILTRRRSLDRATQLAEEIYRAALPLLETEADGRSFRLLGVGVSEIAPAEAADLPDLLDPSVERRAKIERAMDRVRDKLGRDAIIKGRSLD